MSAELAIGVAIVAGFLAALWGSFLGVRSSTAGGIWTLRHLRLVVRVASVLGVIGVVMAFVVEPFFLGAAIAYIALVVAFFARIVKRSVQTAMNLDDGRADPLPPERQAPILRKAGRGLLTVGLVLVGIGFLDLSWRGWPASLDFAFAAVLLVPGVLYLRRAAAIAA